MRPLIQMQIQLQATIAVQSQKARKLQATLEGCNPKLRLTHSLTRVKCRATSVAKKLKSRHGLWWGIKCNTVTYLQSDFYEEKEIILDLNKLFNFVKSSQVNWISIHYVYNCSSFGYISFWQVFTPKGAHVSSILYFASILTFAHIFSIKKSPLRDFSIGVGWH